MRGKYRDVILPMTVIRRLGAMHKDYFLAGLLEQGIAYHIGYLPSAIRMRIEKLFKDEKITTSNSIETMCISYPR